MEHASRHPSGAKNLEWLLDFCKLCGLLFYAIFSYFSSDILYTTSFHLFVRIFIPMASASPNIDLCFLKYSSTCAFTNGLYLIRVSRKTLKSQSHVPGPLVREIICNLTPTFLCNTCNFTKIYRLSWIKANFKFQKPFPLSNKNSSNLNVGLYIRKTNTLYWAGLR